MTEDYKHPITPPPELVEEWFNNSPIDRGLTLATKAAQWGADMELEACCEWLDDTDCKDPQEASLRLRWHRRPKPPSLKEQALEALDRMQDQWPNLNNKAVIRRAIEQLPD